MPLQMKIYLDRIHMHTCAFIGTFLWLKFGIDVDRSFGIANFNEKWIRSRTEIFDNDIPDSEIRQLSPLYFVAG